MRHIKIYKFSYTFIERETHKNIKYLQIIIFIYFKIFLINQLLFIVNLMIKLTNY